MVVQVIITAGIPVVASAAIQAATQLGRFPGITPGELLRTALDIQGLRTRGLDPLFVKNPFEPGGFILGFKGQTFGPEIAAAAADRARLIESFQAAPPAAIASPAMAPAPSPPSPPPAMAALLPFDVEEEAVKVAFQAPNRTAASVVNAIGCTSRATSLEQLRRCQGGV